MGFLFKGNPFFLYNLVMENIKSDNILVCIDGSYFLYYVIFGAVREFQDKNAEEANILIKEPEDVDQKNLPDLLISDSFKRCLKKLLIQRFETVDWILQQNFQDQIDLANDIHYVFAMDDFVSNSFRRELYPEYKATRSEIKRAYDVSKIRNYLLDVLIPELEISKSSVLSHYNFIKVNGAEGDDLIAWIMMNHNGEMESDKYFLKILIASDHDFLQIPGINQYDLSGKKISAKVKVKGQEIDLDSSLFLRQKIIMGDSSDNIPAIYPKTGPVKAYKLASDHDALKNLLIENQDSARQFKLNRDLIDFRMIPDQLKDSMRDTINPIFKKLFNETKEKSSILSKESLVGELMEL